MFAHTRTRSWVARAAVTTLAVGTLALAGSGAALAQGGGDAASVKKPAAAPQDVPSGSAAIQRGDRIAWLKDSKDNSGAPVIEFSLKYKQGNPRLAYCIDFAHNAAKTGSRYDRSDWNSSNVKNLPKIQWILTNSYPHVSAAKVLSAAGASSEGLPDAAFVAYVGTQTAIWHYSDGVEITGNWSQHGGPLAKGLSPAEYTAAMKVRSYLISKANNADQPVSPAVSIAPQSRSGYAGETVGPFTVSVTGSVTDLKLTARDGTSVVDENGKPLSEVRDGTKFWLRSDNTGKVSVTADGTGTIPTGQVYVVKGHENKFQKLILADTAGTQVSATAGATVGASPSPSPTSASPSASVTTAPASPSASGTAGGGLPVTGTSLPMIIGAAAVLLAAGAGVVLLARRRRIAG